MEPHTCSHLQQRIILRSHSISPLASTTAEFVQQTALSLELTIRLSQQISKNEFRQLQTNLHYIDWFFGNQMLNKQFVQYFHKKSQEFSQLQRKQAFNIAKKIFLRSDKNIFEKVIKEDMYYVLLRCLSYNYQFGDRPSDYQNEFKRIVSYKNVLKLQDGPIVEAYQSTIRIRYLLDYATSMFIQGPAMATLSQIIREKLVSVMQVLSQRPQYMCKLAQIATMHPVTFLQLFSELWEMFKSIMQDQVTMQIKSSFHRQFLQAGLLDTTFKCAFDLANSNSNKQNKIQSNPGSYSRLFQKLLQALNPLLTYRWVSSQQRLVAMFKDKKLHLAQLLIAILKQGDYNLKVIVLLFARQLVQPTQLRLSIKQSFNSYMFNQFTTKLTGIWSGVSDVQTYIDYMIRLYQIDCIRTRRCLIENKLIPWLQDKIQNKYILIAVLKLLRAFLRGVNQQIFYYLRRHGFFRGLREKYHETKKYSRNGVVYSNFLGLLRECRSGGGVRAQYIGEIMFPDQ